MPDLSILIGNQLSKGAAETTLTLEELISSMSASGMDSQSIKDVLMNDLTTGGRLFGPFRNSVKNTVKSGMGMAANEASRTTFEKAGVQEFKWVSIGDKSVCIDCEERHGEIDTMEYFKTVGLPRSGFSICQFSCRCQLVPATYKGENLDKPLLKKEKPRQETSVTSTGLGINDFNVEGRRTNQGWLPLADLKKQAGFENTPNLVSGSEFKSTDGIIVYRGFNGNINFKNDFLNIKKNQWVGEGAYGRGDYFGAGVMALEKAKQFSYIDGDIIQCKIDPSAKIIEYNDLIKRQKSAIKAIDDEMDNLFELRSEGKINKSQFNKERERLVSQRVMIQDEGAFAVSEGFQAAYVRTSDGTVNYMSIASDVGADELVVYDRSILIVNSDY